VQLPLLLLLLLLLLVRGGLMTGIRYRPVVDKALAFH